MASAVKLRRTWFSVHKWLGITLAILIIPISFTGAALVWHDALDEAVNSQHYATTGPVALAPSGYVAAAQAVIAPDERIASIRYPEHDGAPVVVSAAKSLAKGAKLPPGPPQRTNIWLDPATGKVLGQGPANTGLVRVMHNIHGSLMVPGVGRQIVGWIGVAMLISSLTGIWLWWPLTGSMRRGFRWKRQPTTNANLHYLTGLWIAIPLAMLSLTGAWISFPAFFANVSGDKAPNPGDRARNMAAKPLSQTTRTVDQALALAQPLATSAPVQIGWPTDKSPVWKISVARDGGPAEIEVADATGKVTPPKPPRPETTARLMRRLHDGTGMGAVWQVIIFVGGLIPVLLAITGVIMWLRTRTWRDRTDRKVRAARAART